MWELIIQYGHVVYLDGLALIWIELDMAKVENLQPTLKDACRATI